MIEGRIPNTAELVNLLPLDTEWQDTCASSGYADC